MRGNTNEHLVPEHLARSQGLVEKRLLRLRDVYGDASEVAQNLHDGSGVILVSMGQQNTADVCAAVLDGAEQLVVVGSGVQNSASIMHSPESLPSQMSSS